MNSPARFGLTLLLALAGLTVTAVPAVAQPAGDGFLFRQPVAMLTVHGGLTRPDADSEAFSFVTGLLTLDQSDFIGFAGGSTLSVMVTPRVAVGFSGSYSRRTVGSEYRDWVDQDDLPIQQRTTLVRIPLLVSARAYLIPRGERIGSLAWVPAPYSPYVGIGGGAMRYNFSQEGDFIDIVDNSVFNSSLVSAGWAPTVQAIAGVDYTLTPRIVVNGEASYLSAGSELGLDFSGYDIDLSGFSAVLGIAVRL